MPLRIPYAFSSRRSASGLFPVIAPSFSQDLISGQLPQLSVPLPMAHCLIGHRKSQ